jgi:hypothetical protein
MEISSSKFAIALLVGIAALVVESLILHYVDLLVYALNIGNVRAPQRLDRALVAGVSRMPGLGLMLAGLALAAATVADADHQIRVSSFCGLEGHQAIAMGTLVAVVVVVVCGALLTPVVLLFERGERTRFLDEWAPSRDGPEDVAETTAEDILARLIASRSAMIRSLGMSSQLLGALAVVLPLLVTSLRTAHP